MFNINMIKELHISIELCMPKGKKHIKKFHNMF